MSELPEIHGTVSAGFEPVKDAFEANFRDHGEVGAACAVSLDGAMVVDLWAGNADRHGRPWEKDTLVNVYSTTKGLTALCAHILADRGEIDFDAPVSEYWPEFAQAGKDGMPVRYLLTHQAGLPVIDADLAPGSALDWGRMIEAMEHQAPVWEPGSKQGYHAVTFGWLVGEVVRRVAGAARFGDFLAEAVVAPLGLDMFVGTPASEHHRVADLVREQLNGTAAAMQPTTDETPEAKAMRERVMAMFTPGSMAFRSLGLASPPFAAGNNSPEWRSAELPAANGHTNARSLARLYGALARGGEVDGVRLLSAGAVKRAAAEEVCSPDAVLVMETRRSLGFMLPVPGQPDNRGPNSFGHAGAGGSLGYADPDRGIGFGYTMNKMWNMASFMTPDPRAQSLVAAVHGSLDA
ncbi:MAG TPA: serine hydrolase domain-containing protein [Acidimicrobiales bacterium]|nr:serine hydrolase domain-containing protein [Acidimicrobiales bacterium]